MLPVRPALALAIVALVLAACGAPPPPAAPSADGEAYAFDAAQPDVLAVGFAMLEPTFLAVPVTALTEVADGVWFGNFVPLTADDGFAVPLPDPADVPIATLVPLVAAFDNFVDDGCVIDAAPVGAEATFTVFEGLAAPGLVALTAEGSFLMAASDVAIDGGTSLGDFEGTFYSWLYADRDATLTTSGCNHAADLALEEGWNQLAWTPQGADPIEVTVVAASDVLATPLLPFPPSDPIMIVGHD